MDLWTGTRRSTKGLVLPGMDRMDADADRIKAGPGLARFIHQTVAQVEEQRSEPPIPAPLCSWVKRVGAAPSRCRADADPPESRGSACRKNRCQRGGRAASTAFRSPVASPKAANKAKPPQGETGLRVRPISISPPPFTGNFGCTLWSALRFPPVSRQNKEIRASRWCNPFAGAGQLQNPGSDAEARTPRAGSRRRKEFLNFPGTFRMLCCLISPGPRRARPAPRET